MPRGHSLIPELGFLCIQISRPVNPSIRQYRPEFPPQSAGTDSPNQTDSDAEAMWRTYIMLTDLEAVFRSRKSEVGLRPIYHQKRERSKGHLFIIVLAYQLVQVIRRRLREHQEHRSWTGVREILAGQQRVTASYRRADGSTLHVRKATVAEPEQRFLYEILGLDAAPGGVKKLVVA